MFVYIIVDQISEYTMLNFYLFEKQLQKEPNILSKQTLGWIKMNEMISNRMLHSMELCSRAGGSTLNGWLIAIKRLFSFILFFLTTLRTEVKWSTVRCVYQCSNYANNFTLNTTLLTLLAQRQLIQVCCLFLCVNPINRIERSRPTPTPFSIK